jgi:hypothetical protein
MARREPWAESATYELRIQGALGPLLLSALPHTAARRVDEHSVVIMETEDGRELLDVLALIVGSGVEVESVRAQGRRSDHGVPGAGQL